MVRAAYALGGLGSGLCGDEEKLRETTEKVCGKHDHHDDHHHVIIIITIIIRRVCSEICQKNGYLEIRNCFRRSLLLTKL